MKVYRLICVLLFLAGVLPSRVDAQIFINEIQYHPVEQSVFDGSVGRTFDAAGNTIYSDTLAAADYSEDIHEFIELFNAGTENVDLGGWRFSQGVTYSFPAGTIIAPGAYKVIARNPARIQTVYGITGVLGPFVGKLSNDGDTITLMNAANGVADSVTYSAHFPWAQSADALAVSKDWLGFDPVANQYKGRSLQRVSLTSSPNDPANWVASPLNPGPSPGAANPQSRPVPKPVVVAFSVAQSVGGSPTIRANNAVTVSATFGSTASLSAVQVEYFVDDVNSYTEARNTVNLVEAPAGSGQYTGTIPGLGNRAIVRYRFKANRGTGTEVVSPRADDPQIVPVSATTKEGWHSYFVSPVRTSTKPIYDCFVSTSSIAVLNTNINQSPSRRITPEGNPREVPYVLPTAPQWNGVQPAIVVYNGVVYDIMFRFHGSRYRRSEARQSYKWQFPRSNLFQGTIQEVFETDKARDTGNHPNTEWAHAIYRAAGIPTSYTQHVDLYFNNNINPIEQLEQSVCDDRLLERYYNELYKRDRSQPELLPGDVYKCKSTDEGSTGPYVTYTGQKLTTNRASTTGNIWTPLHQYRWNLTMQNNEWKGWKPLKDMVDAMWTVKSTNNTNTIRAWLAANWDVDRTLTEIAIRNWSCCWDDSFHNYYLYREANGKWTMLPWDFDYEFADKPASSDIYTTSGNSFKEIFLTYYRAEYRQKLWLLNNTLLAPANLVAMGINFGTWNTDRQTYVNSTLALGIFQRPNKPVAAAPSGGAGAISPAVLSASAYTHTSGSVTGVSAHAKSTWEIRTATGTYTDPLYSITSTTNRESLPIPFAELTLGQTYFWRVTYYDAQDHPSFTADETSFIYGAGPITENPIVMDASTQWKYNISIQPAVTVWTASDLDDTGWLTGPAPLGHSDSTALPVPIRTDLGATTRVTCYFRKQFDYNGPLGPGTILKLRQYIDDGVVFYLNGQELQRTRVGAGFADQYSQTANGLVITAAIEPSATSWFTVPSTALKTGSNVLAASVHQGPGETTDYIFGAELQISYSPIGGSVVINEICADNHSIVSNGGSYPDYVELFNSGSTDVDLSGFGLTDDPLLPGKFIFPNGTTLAVGAYMLVWCDRDLTAPGLHT
ncbi:MAG: hypothetical protein JWL90_307, partial [Chthoniobacteraceae bacterium]|nr:hypothetical protein [Chthoniobacteraceae bacterium]